VTATLPDTLDRSVCVRLDEADPLAAVRDRFRIPDDVVYMDGNSLGALPLPTAPRLAQVVDQEWGGGLVRSWTDAPWMDSPLRVGAKIARLIGAQAEEVLVTDTTSINIFKLVTAVLRSRPHRRVVVTEADNFPTDLYATESAASLLEGRSIRVVDRAAIAEALDKGVALLTLTHVDFRTGEIHAMAELTKAAHEAGALMLWDLSHSVGAIPVDLASAGVDLAVGCGYKYLNGGPGAPAFLFVARRLHQELDNPIHGFLGHDKPFALERGYRRAAGIRSWMTSSPSILGIAALEAGVDLALDVDTGSVAEKGHRLTDLFIRLADSRLGAFGFDLASPRDAQRRGAQVSLRHESGYGVVRALIERGVIPDFREPDICRFGMAPLYTRFVDVWDAIDHTATVMQTRAYENPAYAERGFVT
jgi:kynureninase